jgi:hypothetical protein
VIAIEAFLKTQEQVMTDYIFNPQGIGQGFSGAVNDIFAGEADLAKAKFDIAEQQEYQLAAGYAGTNEQYTAMSTAIKEAQQNREVTQALGKTTASIAGAGFAASGSGLDILRSGAQQGAIMQAITAQQGLVTEAGYAEQEASYNIMASAAGQAATAAQTAATGAFIGAGISAVTGFLPTPAKSS